MKKIFISAGEQSGDLHGSNLIIELLKKEPEIEIHGLGNEKMIATGMRCVHDMTKQSVMWLHALAKIPEFFKILSDTKKFFRTQRPDLVILIDFCGLNFYIAKAAKKLGIPVMYYISPQVWAHANWRVKKVKKLVDKMVVIYPFEVDLYKNAGVNVKYVGNPIADYMRNETFDEEYAAGLKSENGDDIISLFPGSRKQEVEKFLPILLTAAKMIHKARPGGKFLISCSERRHLEFMQREAGRFSIPYKIVVGNLQEVVSASKICLACSGTVTLKIAYYLKPMVIIYKISSLAYFVVKPFMHTPYLSLVNKYAEEFIVPERLMRKNDYKWMVSSALELMDNAGAREKCVNKLKEVKKIIDYPGASAKAANEALEMIAV